MPPPTSPIDQEPHILPPTVNAQPPKKAKGAKMQRFKTFIKTHKKEVIIFSIIFVALAGFAGWAYATNHRPFNSPDTLARKDKPPTTKPSPLTGVVVDNALAERPVTGVMIENSPDARPQTGVGDAGVVFEAVAEGGITRYLTLFQETRPASLGPVRSLRPYYLDWVMGYDASIGHVGGSYDALQQVGQRGAKDLDQFKYGTKAYERVGFREAPHNVYTNFDKLDALSQGLGYTSSTFTPYERKDDVPLIPATHATLSFDFSGPQYSTSWSYDAATNTYLRSNGGVPDVDRDSGLQLRAKNIVYIPMPTTYDGKYAVMATVGSGDAVVFLDGDAKPVKWSKSDYKAMIELKNPDGTNLQLNRGTTWFEIVPAGRTATY